MSASIMRLLSIRRACLGRAFLGEQPTFDRLTDIRAHFVHCLAL